MATTAAPARTAETAERDASEATADLGDNDLRDGRDKGDWRTRYFSRPCQPSPSPNNARAGEGVSPALDNRGLWIAAAQISLEAFFSLVIFAVAGMHLAAIAAPRAHLGPDAAACWLIGKWVARAALPHDDAVIALWSAVFFGGVLGSNVFSTKWLYHSVATQWWHQDRFLWRIFVPIQGGVLAVFVGLMALAKVVPNLPTAPFERYATAAGFGFFIGLLADNVISSVSKLIRVVLQQLVQGASRALGYSEPSERRRPKSP